MKPEDSYSTFRNVGKCSTGVTKSKFITYPDGKNYRIDIFDTAGQEEYRDMLSSLFNEECSIDGFLMVYDITSRNSLDNLEYFEELITQNAEKYMQSSASPPPVKLVIGNKCDLGEGRIVSTADGRAWAQAHGCGFIETSARAMINVEETFENLIRQIAHQRRVADDHRAVLEQKVALDPETTLDPMVMGTVEVTGKTGVDVRPGIVRSPQSVEDRDADLAAKKACCSIS